MYCAKYYVEQFPKCIILRFSKNNFVSSKLKRYDDDHLNDFLMQLKEIAEKDKECYNTLYPWEDITELQQNREVIIIYNIVTHHIQCWCNIKYEKINTNGSSLYTCYIDKIIVRDKPKIQKIGTLMIDFIRKECFMEKIIFSDLQGNITINMDILYLYSLSTSIDFYNRNPILSSYPFDYKENIDINEANILKHVFIIFSDNIRRDRNFNSFIQSTKWKDFRILHSFEINSIMDDESIAYYRNFEAPIICNNPNTKIQDEKISITGNINKYIPYMLDFKRKSSKPITYRPSKPITSRSVIKKTRKYKS